MSDSSEGSRRRRRSIPFAECTIRSGATAKCLTNSSRRKAEGVIEEIDLRERGLQVLEPRDERVARLGRRGFLGGLAEHLADHRAHRLARGPQRGPRAAGEEPGRRGDAAVEERTRTGRAAPSCRCVGGRSSPGSCQPAPKTHGPHFSNLIGSQIWKSVQTRCPSGTSARSRAASSRELMPSLGDRLEAARAEADEVLEVDEVRPRPRRGTRRRASSSGRRDRTARGAPSRCRRG